MLKRIIALFVLLSGCSAGLEKSNMNVLFVFTDQQNRYALGCMDNPNVITPNLDDLAEKGVLFSRCYSNDPVCGPFRGLLMTGQYSSRCGVTSNGLPLPSGVTTFAEAFAASGYSTSWVGKWHLGGIGNKPIKRELQGGFERFTGYQCYNGFHKDVVFHNHNMETRRFDRHRTEVTTDLAIEELQHLANKDKPFMLMMSYQAPHYPEQPSEKYAKMYEGKKIIRRKNCRDIDPFTPTYSPRSPRPVENDPDYQNYGNDLDKYILLYNAMCTQIDANIGRLVAELERLGIADNTMIVYTSDHGDMQGSHGLKNKCLPHEESAGIPLIVYMPGQKGGIKSDALVSGVDMLPTCLDAANLPPLSGVDGVSFAPVLRGEKQKAGTEIFAERDKWCMIVRDNWKLAANRCEKNLRPTYMFNLAEDPYEFHNLVKNPDFESVRSSLLKRLQEWNDDLKE